MYVILCGHISSSVNSVIYSIELHYHNVEDSSDKFYFLVTMLKFLEQTSYVIYFSSYLSLEYVLKLFPFFSTRHYIFVVSRGL